MVKHKKFTKSLLTKSISVLLGTSVLAPVVAQEAEVERIQVTGIRGSIQEAMGIKRDSAGVVDAISAEDIGKFPDTNLAESLQRITGVSIDRQNGEGNAVTVRGFGPDYNMVTLNGRTMPGASLPGGGGTPNSRTFDFSNLASESVRSIQVYKTGRASIATGGIGASIDIRTARPFDAVDTGITASVGAKGLMDTTNRVGSDVTPEVSGFFNYVDDNETFGVNLSVSVQERDSSATRAFVNQWRTNEYDGTNIPHMITNTDVSGPATIINNGPAIGQLFSIPSDLRYAISDDTRKRTNAQLTVQFAPTDNLVATLDYTYSEQELTQSRAEQSIWMDDSYFSSITFDGNTVASPILLEQQRRELAPRDLGLALQELNQLNENKSLGLNIAYNVNDNLSFELDYHSSTADANPNAPYGTWMNLGLGANIARGQTADFSGDFPVMLVDFDDVSRGNLNPNNMLDNGDIGTAILDMNHSSQETDIDQLRLDGSYVFEDGAINFGIESRSMENTSQQGLTRRTMGNWGVENPGELPADFLTPFDFQTRFDDHNTSNIFNQGVTGSASQIGAWAGGQYGFDFAATDPLATDRTIKEDIDAVYFELDLEGELGGMPYNVLAGLRYESADVTSVAVVAVPDAVVWESNNDFRVNFGTTSEDYALTSSYDHMLPSLDFDIEVVENVMARFSYSKTIARPRYNDLSASATLNSPSGPTFITGQATATATSGNPALVPLESDNFDLSVEYYFDDTSYVSIGYYEKRVENFVGTAPVEENLFGLRDSSAGPRAIAAAAALEAIGQPVNDTTLFQMIAATENGVDYFSMTVEEFEQAYDVLPNADDPLLEFINSKPVNNKEARIDGFEIAAQHFFGDTGFGVQANYTTVNGDVGFDVTADPTVTQFALLGLSDTANLVLMYENHGIQARIAYNWRDKFLNNTARYSNEPAFTEDYSQIDFNVSYEVNEQLSVFFEGINITEEDSRQHGRAVSQLWQLDEQGARYAVGARYTF